ncbi:MAG TPA: DSD1 family PLP-dependent enzyme, partial [Candidatus Binatia bacterium]|nr:DSD1 family PLP-dependent enzyme [Candidatus Binatia bacterium]
MKRRHFLLGAVGAGAAAVAGAFAARPKDEGAPYDAYFRALNDELRRNGPMKPSLVVDLDRLDRNIAAVVSSVQPRKHFRVVEKSLPCLGLLDYVQKRAGTNRLMSFHQPFLSLDAERLPKSDILLGKPMPARAAERFYRGLKGRFDPARQLQWLVDTPERLSQYRELAAGLGTRLRVNVEIDVGLHRGGVRDEAALEAMLSQIAASPDRLEFSGFMGYDPHVVKIPAALASQSQLFANVMSAYRRCVEHLRTHHAPLWREDLTLNTAGSPTYKLHEAEDLSNDISVGSALVKPADFDVPTLAHHEPACFIATPVLKASEELRLAGLEDKSRWLSQWDVNQRRTFFIYGGHWMARYESPRGLRPNALFGHSSNQEMANGSPAVGLGVDDHVFLRPSQSEALFLQFGDVLTVR